MTRSASNKPFHSSGFQANRAFESKEQKTTVEQKKQSLKEVLTKGNESFNANQANPTKSAAHAILTSKTAGTNTLNFNLEAKGRTHFGKMGAVLAANKLIYNKDPTVKEVVKEVTLFSFGDIFKSAAQIDRRLEAFIVDPELRAIVGNVASSLAMNSAMSGFSKPTLQDLVVYSIPEVIDTYVLL